MNCAMEMHDSFLLEVKMGEDGRGYALFHAVIHRSNGRVFQDAQESGWQNLRYDFEGMRIEGEIGELDRTYASDGELWVDGKNENGVIFLPANHGGDLCLEMMLSDDFRTLKIHASKISSTLLGEFQLEHLWDEEGNVAKPNA